MWPPPKLTQGTPDHDDILWLRSGSRAGTLETHDAESSVISQKTLKDRSALSDRSRLVMSRDEDEQFPWRLVEDEMKDCTVDLLGLAGFDFDSDAGANHPVNPPRWPSSEAHLEGYTGS